MPSLFEEQFDRPVAEAQAGQASGGVPFAENLAYFHELKEYNRGPDIYLKQLAAAKQALRIPIIGSLNVTAPGDWIRCASRIEEAGADALELNIYFLAADPQTTGRDIEARYVELVAAVRQQVSIPLAVKVGPYFTAFANVAHSLVEAGADGLVLFNRFMQPEIDLSTLRVSPRLTFSSSEELRIAMRWIAMLHGRLKASLAATGGAPFCRRRDQAHPGRRRRGDDRLDAVPSWRGSARDARQRRAVLAGKQRLSESGPGSRNPQPAKMP